MITTAEILAALATAATGHGPSVGPADAHTGTEIRAAMRWTTIAFKREMTRLKVAGLIEVVRVTREAVDGRMANVVGYRCLPGPPAPALTLTTRRA